MGDSDSDDDMPNLQSDSDSSDIPDLASSDESSDDDYESPPPPPKKQAKEPEKDFRSSFQFKFPATAKPAPAAPKAAPKGKITEINADDDDDGPPPLVDDTDEETGSDESSDGPPELAGDSDSDSGEEPMPRPSARFGEEDTEYYKQQQRINQEKAERKRLQKEKAAQEELQREAKRKERKEKRARERKEREENAKKQGTVPVAELKAVSYTQFTEKAPEEKKEEDTSKKLIDHKCILSNCQWTIIKAYEALVLLKCNDKDNHCRLHFHKSCYKQSIQAEVLGKGSFGDTLTPPCITKGCNGTITKIEERIQGKIKRVIPLVSMANAPADTGRKNWRKDIAKEAAPTPAPSSTLPPPVATAAAPPVSAKKAPAKEKEPGATLVAPYDPLANERKKPSTKKEKEKEKEVKETQARIKAQEAKKQARIAELQEQVRNAPIPSLDETPEGGVWKGGGVYEEELTEQDKLIKDLREIENAREKEKKSKNKKKKKQKLKPALEFQEAVKQAEEKKADAWRKLEEERRQQAEQQAMVEAEEEEQLTKQLQQAVKLSAESAAFVPSSSSTATSAAPPTTGPFMSTDEAGPSYTPLPSTADFVPTPQQVAPSRQPLPNSTFVPSTSPTVFMDTYVEAQEFKPTQTTPPLRSPVSSPGSPIDALAASQGSPSPHTILAPSYIQPTDIQAFPGIPLQTLPGFLPLGVPPMPLFTDLTQAQWQIQQMEYQKQMIMQQLELQKQQLLVQQLALQKQQLELQLQQQQQQPKDS